MTRNDFIESRRTAELVTEGVHWSAKVDPSYLRMQAKGAQRRGEAAWWTFCAPVGARVACPNGLPVHGPAVCGPSLAMGGK